MLRAPSFYSGRPPQLTVDCKGWGVTCVISRNLRDANEGFLFTNEEFGKRRKQKRGKNKGVKKTKVKTKGEGRGTNHHDHHNIGKLYLEAEKGPNSGLASSGLRQEDWKPS